MIIVAIIATVIVTAIVVLTSLIIGYGLGTRNRDE
jgi:hypothetical protein